MSDKKFSVGVDGNLLILRLFREKSKPRKADIRRTELSFDGDAEYARKAARLVVGAEVTLTTKSTEATDNGIEVLYGFSVQRKLHEVRDDLISSFSRYFLQNGYKEEK